MSDLDDEELRETKKHNGADKKIVIDIRTIDEKIAELENTLLAMTDERDYYYFQGVIRTLEKIKKGNISRL